MASFVSAAAAIRCATRIQRDLAKHCRDNNERPLKVRIGVAAGEPVEHHEDLFGSTVQLAARLCSYAMADQIVAIERRRRAVCWQKTSVPRLGRSHPERVSASRPSPCCNMVRRGGSLTVITVCI